MQSQRSSLLDEQGNLEADPGSRDWSIAVMREIKLSIQKVESDAVSAGNWLKAANMHCAWKALGFVSFETWLTAIGIDASIANALVNAKRGQTVGDVFRQQADKARKQAKGITQGTRTDLSDEPRNNVTKLGRGNSCDYQLRRLARDHPDILDRFEAGEFPSVRQAAIAAGIVKEKTKDELAVAAWRKAENRLLVLTKIVDDLEPYEREALIELCEN